MSRSKQIRMFETEDLPLLSGGAYGGAAEPLHDLVPLAECPSVQQVERLPGVNDPTLRYTTAAITFYTDVCAGSNPRVLPTGTPIFVVDQRKGRYLLALARYQTPPPAKMRDAEYAWVDPSFITCGSLRQ